MKASVFIPCTSSHFFHLPKVIDAYKRGSAVPEEIVVFSSGMRHVSKDDITNFQNNYPDVQLVCADSLVKAGPARQTAHELCSGDIIIFQDADDAPHYRRVQFVKHFFTTTDSVVINHSWQNYDNYPGADFDLRETKINFSSELYDIYWPNKKFGEILKFTNVFGAGLGMHFHDGALSVRRELLEKYRFKAPHELTIASFNRDKAECFEFLCEVWFETNKGLFIRQPIYFYKT